MTLHLEREPGAADEPPRSARSGGGDLGGEDHREISRGGTEHPRRGVLWAAFAVTALVLLAFAGGVAVGSASSPGRADLTVDESSGEPSASGEADATPGGEATGGGSGTQLVDDAQLATRLSYLIEEEKLAHDVYVSLGELWGSNIFTNIARSEVRHQEAVAGLLADAGLDDPRLEGVGEFVDPEIQALYDDLVARGSVSRTAAFEVGVEIETIDIADLAEHIDAIDDERIDAVLQQLLDGSRSHLAAFERQLG